MTNFASSRRLLSLVRFSNIRDDLPAALPGAPHGPHPARADGRSHPPRPRAGNHAAAVHRRHRRRRRGATARLGRARRPFCSRSIRADFAIDLFRLPVRNVVADARQTDFFIPGSLIALRPDPAHSLMAGVQSDAAAVFVRSRAFAVEPGASGVTVAARFPATGLLLSGWALGAERHIGDRAAVVRARVDAGTVVLVGFRPLFRGQPHSTFRIVFNAIWDAASVQSSPVGGGGHAGGIVR